MTSPDQAPELMPDIVERLRVYPAGYGEDTLAVHNVVAIMKAAADEIDRLRATPPGSPLEREGWKLVPIEPTQAMIEVGCDNNPTSWNEGTDDGFASDVANDVYISMVRAAPTPSPSPTEREGE